MVYLLKMLSSKLCFNGKVYTYNRVKFKSCPVIFINPFFLSHTVISRKLWNSIIILGTFKLKVLTTVWEEVSLPKSFDPKLTSFLIQIGARMYMYL